MPVNRRFYNMYNTKYKEDNLYKLKLPESTKNNKSIIKLYVAEVASKDITNRIEKMSKELLISVLKSLIK
jgi:hypothetical protein